MKFVYFGSSQFSCVILDALIRDGKVPSLAVTVPDKPSGRGLKIKSAPVKTMAENAGIEVLSPLSLKDNSFIERLASVSPEIFIAVSYGRIIPKNVLDIASIIPIAVHPSLLPLYRGAAPINWAVINGEKQTGTSVIKISEKVDAGDIIIQKALLIDNSDDAVTLSAKLAELSAEALLEAISYIEEGRYTLTPQDESKATFAPKINKKDGMIIWSKSALSINNMVRGMLPWPEAFTFYKGKLVKILKAESSTRRVETMVGVNGAKPSVILRIDKEGIYVAAGEGVVIIKRVKPEGKKEMDAYAFSRGYRLKVGEVFG